MYELKKMERYLRVNLLGPGPRLMKKEFTGPRSHRVWETLAYSIFIDSSTAKTVVNQVKICWRETCNIGKICLVWNRVGTIELERGMSREHGPISGRDKSFFSCLKHLDLL